MLSLLIFQSKDTAMEAISTVLAHCISKIGTLNYRVGRKIPFIICFIPINSHIKIFLFILYFHQFNNIKVSVYTPHYHGYNLSNKLQDYIR
jgi:hypothetical protein